MKPGISCNRYRDGVLVLVFEATERDSVDPLIFVAAIKQAIEQVKD
ncbi:MAG TPA: hypothetical protein VFL19_03740 [Nitrospira sp.]|nr:hypothetical protein [Nitrospira sp.]